jgi:hypothetical protein
MPSVKSGTVLGDAKDPLLNVGRWVNYWVDA